MKASYTSLSSTTALPWIAKGGGLFEKQGLDVTLDFLSPATLTAGLVSGSVDIGYGSPGSVATADVHGGDLVILGATYEGSTFSIVARPEIKVLADLKGKKVGATQRGATTDFLIHQVAQQQGFGPSDVNVIYIPEQAQQIPALSTGALDAAVLTEPLTSAAVAQGGHVIFGPDTPGNNFVSMSVVLTKRSYVPPHRDLLKRFLAANIAAAKLAKTNTGQAAAYMGPYLKIEDQDVLRSSLQSSLSVIRDDLSLTMPGLQQVLTATATTDPEVTKLKPQDLVDLSLVDELKASPAA
ncbi:MAG: ABC transporter substrate-binding protein [Chloroflexota bacterium]